MTGDEPIPEELRADPAVEEDLARLARGSIPVTAERRIRALARSRTGFTAGMSVADLALARASGLRPICQVMGSSVYQVGLKNLTWAGNVPLEARSEEIGVLTTAWNHVRSLALGRLAEEARAARCHAVIGVSFEIKRDAFVGSQIEVVATGTAVHLPDGEDDGAAVLTDLSVVDYVLLRRAGYRPVGVVTATSVFFVSLGPEARRRTSGFQGRLSIEVADYTQGLYSARELAIGRACAEAERLGADGLVGMSIDQLLQPPQTGHEQNSQPPTTLIVTFHVLGTAITRATRHSALDPQTILRLGSLSR
jgi:uncharacterized protein YbjQ (UPF0145 family)